MNKRIRKEVFIIIPGVRVGDIAVYLKVDCASREKLFDLMTI